MRPLYFPWKVAKQENCATKPFNMGPKPDKAKIIADKVHIYLKYLLASKNYDLTFLTSYQFGLDLVKIAHLISSFF